MTARGSLSFLVLAVILSAGPALAQDSGPETNAALRYWSAFSAMQDAAITSEQASDLKAILGGKSPYSDSKFKGLIAKNRIPLQIMAKATTLPECDWGLDYSLGENEPVEYVRAALVLGRLNVLYAFHLLTAGKKEAAVTTLASGLRFSRDVANGGTLFATLMADELISEHLRAVGLIVHTSGLSAAQRTQLHEAVTRLGADGLDWQAAVQRELQVTRDRLAPDTYATSAFARIDSAYAAALRNPSRFPFLQDVLRKYPKFARLMPDPKVVLRQKHDLDAQILRTRALFE